MRIVSVVGTRPQLIKEAALGPVLRDSTEWVEAVEGSGGRMVVVGLDAGRAGEALERLAPVHDGPARARARAATLELPSAGAAKAIATALDASSAV